MIKSFSLSRELCVRSVRAVVNTVNNQVPAKQGRRTVHRLPLLVRTAPGALVVLVLPVPTAARGSSLAL